MKDETDMINYAGQILKSYELKELIDTGGFGAIYRANQTVVEREVAIKIIFPDFASRPNFIRRFEAEAQMVAGLEHPSIVPLYDYWRDPNGAYIVMRWLRGGHLRRLMHGMPMQVADVARITEQIGTALIFAHRYGVVHRDLKPENILLDEVGNAYLADFGIAQIMSSTRDDDEMASMGSPAYAAPEQIAGEQTTPLTDQYSLAVILYEMLTGRHPFPDLAEMTLTELTAKRISEPLPPLSLLRPDLPSAIGQIIQRASALRPAERFEDIATMLATLQMALEPLLATSRTSRANAIISRTQQIAALTLDLPNPYKGLRTFQESDAVNFFGRRTLIDRLTERMRDSGAYHRFLAVVGPSGSGKSSVVKAGLIPALRKGALSHSKSWYYVEIVPGVQPFKELEAALTSIAVQPPRDLDERLMRNPRELISVVSQILQGDQTTELFLLIDQFEELFTQVSETVRDRFLESLYIAISTPGSRIRIVVTLRADFYDRPLLLPTISEIMRLRTEVITPLSPSELGEAIVEPARRLGVSLEAGLESAIIQEVTDHPGALPLLQYLMSELFQRRDGMMMTLAAYREMGGVRGALAKRAEEIYESFSPQQRIAMQKLYLRLITLGEGTEDTRRRPLLAEVTTLSGDPTIIRDVIEVLGKARLSPSIATRKAVRPPSR
jgi:serine/threonine protein kinase